MKFYAVYKVVREEHVEIEADNWQEAAQKAKAMKRPVITVTDPLMEGIGLCQCEDPQYCAHYDGFHEIIGPCNKCGTYILERGCNDECKAVHGEKDGYGWCSTKHGHVTWCSQECRDVDRENDCDLEVLDRMAGI